MTELNKVLPYSRQHINEDDIAAVLKVLRSDFLTQGEEVPGFEAEFAAVHQVPFAIAVSNATAGLHLACLALEVGAGDLVWTTPNSFLASANCALYCGAQIDFVDIDPQTRQLSLSELASKLERAQAEKRLPKLVIAVDFAGLPCDWPGLRRLADAYGFALLQDASHATGASLNGKMMASDWADASVFSFHAVKVITTAEGGMVCCRDPKLAARIQTLRSHGMVRDPAQMHDAPAGPWVYEQQSLGYNYRMTEMQAALGRSQLRRLPQMQERREALAERYDQLLTGLPLRLPPRIPGRRSAWHLYSVELLPGPQWADRATVFARLKAQNLGVQVHYIPIHLQPYYRALGFAAGDFPAAEAYYAQTISLPLFPGMSEAEQDRVLACLQAALPR